MSGNSKYVTVGTLSYFKNKLVNNVLVDYVTDDDLLSIIDDYVTDTTFNASISSCITNSQLSGILADYIATDDLLSCISLPNQTEKTAKNNIWIDESDNPPSIIYKVGSNTYKIQGTQIN